MPAVLALVVLVLGALIFHDVISPPTPAAATQRYTDPGARETLTTARAGQTSATAPRAGETSSPPRGSGPPACITLQNQVQTDLNRQASDQLAGQRQLNQAQNAITNAQD